MKVVVLGGSAADVTSSWAAVTAKRYSPLALASAARAILDGPKSRPNPR
ncbi:hypothetical protein BH09MYX1_BH09MYX1_18960 [soil metagenome]